MQIITGKTGTTHVQAEDDRALHAATFGTDMYVLNVGSKFAISSSTTNSLTLSDGELVLQGCHARIRHGENETLPFTNGATGENRIDLVCAKYKKVSGIESMELVVYEGDRTTGTPSAPSYVEGNILEGSEEVDMPLYKITLTGLNVSITPMFTIATGLDDVYRKNEVYKKTETYNKNEVYKKNDVYTKAEVLNIVYPVGSIYMSINNVNPSALFGGTWVAWGSGRVPVGVNTSDANFNTVEKTGGSTTHALTIEEMPRHTHNVRDYGNLASGEGIHEISTVNNANASLELNTYSGTLTETGAGQAHNNLQPYITCYMWKRTA